MEAKPVPSVNSIDETFTTYDKEKLLDILLNSSAKTNEKITNDVMKMNGNTIYVKDYDKIKSKDIQFALSHATSKESMSYWTVPFYNTKDDKVSIIVWNNKDEDPINVNFIINNDKKTKAKLAKHSKPILIKKTKSDKIILLIQLHSSK